MDKIRINKYLASKGVCSRREADRLIDEGLVTVNGVTATLGLQVNELDEILVDGIRVEASVERVVYAFYKPKGVTCTREDPHAESTIYDYIDIPMSLAYAGRLDRDSEGLLLLTNDGDLINRLMRGSDRYGVHEKEYMVYVSKKVSPVFLERMERGVLLPEKEDYQKVSIARLNERYDAGEGVVKTLPCKCYTEDDYSFRIILTQGLNRQIRRMCRELGYKVDNIKRIRVENITLGDLRPGEYRELTERERADLYHAVGLD